MAPEANSDARVSALEQKYIDLLERRVADLEARLASATVNGEVTKPIITKETVADGAAKKADDPAVDGKNGTKPSKEEEKDAAEDVRYRVVLNSLDPESGEFIDRTPDAANTKGPETTKSNRAFTFRKFMRTQSLRGEEVLRSTRSEVEIEFVPLQLLLGKITSKYAEVAKITELVSPYMNLVWCWEEAEKEANLETPKEDDRTKMAREDLKELLKMISTSSGDESLDRYFKSKSSMKEAGTVTFDSLWTLFPKGSHIVSRPFFNENQVFMVQSLTLPNMDDTNANFTVIAYGYDWNGMTFNRVPYAFTVGYFTDKKTIFELPFYPLSEQTRLNVGPAVSKKSSGGSLEKELEKRGKKFFDFCAAQKGKQTFRYEGMAFSERGAGIFGQYGSDDDSESLSSRAGFGSSDGTSQEISLSSLEELVVIDFRSYFEFQSSSSARLGDLAPWPGRRECQCTDCKLNFEHIYRYSWDQKKPKDKDKLGREQYMMFPPRVLGYSLKRKRWFQLLVDGVKDPGEADRTNFDKKLMLTEENKELISKSVRAYGKENIVDYIPGKGKGLVILLWGAPGVGKTLTAESVAALAGKPLFSIGVSDIGTKSKLVETNLERIFALAGRWEAVLLLDEADVFLEARDARGSDMERNSMVSVLLRILEYYDGILILTTNRLKIFDIAVRSRIHIAVEYTELDKDQRTRIFEDFLGQLSKRNLVDMNACMKWVRQEGCRKSVNGRQIRNIVFTAMGLAHSEGAGTKLGTSHLIDVTRNTEVFRDALVEQEAVFRNNQLSGRMG